MGESRTHHSEIELIADALGEWQVAVRSVVAASQLAKSNAELPIALAGRDLARLEKRLQDHGRVDRTIEYLDGLIEQHGKDALRPTLLELTEGLTIILGADGARLVANLLTSADTSPLGTVAGVATHSARLLVERLAIRRPRLRVAILGDRLKTVGLSLLAKADEAFVGVAFHFERLDGDTFKALVPSSRLAGFTARLLRGVVEASEHAEGEVTLLGDKDEWELLAKALKEAQAIVELNTALFENAENE